MTFEFNENEKHFIIKNEQWLLEEMLKDYSKVPEFFRPGPYWKKKSIVSSTEIRKFFKNYKFIIFI